jgi:hypothetical protein
MLRRHNKPWKVRELLNLQREFELLNLPIFEIAELHQRTDKAIMYRLQQEGFITNDWTNVNGYNTNASSLDNPVKNYLSNDEKLDIRISLLESSIKNIYTAEHLKRNTLKGVGSKRCL